MKRKRSEKLCDNDRYYVCSARPMKCSGKIKYGIEDRAEKEIKSAKLDYGSNGWFITVLYFSGLSAEEVYKAQDFFKKEGIEIDPKIYKEKYITDLCCETIDVTEEFKNKYKR